MCSGGSARSGWEGGGGGWLPRLYCVFFSSGVEISVSLCLFGGMKKDGWGSVLLLILLENWKFVLEQ